MRNILFVGEGSGKNLILGVEKPRLCYFVIPVVYTLFKLKPQTEKHFLFFLTSLPLVICSVRMRPGKKRNQDFVHPRKMKEDQEPKRKSLLFLMNCLLFHLFPPPARGKNAQEVRQLGKRLLIYKYSLVKRRRCFFSH